MSEKDKGFSFRRLFIRDAGSGTQENQIQKAEPSGIKTREDYISNSIPNKSTGAQDQTLVEDFVQRLQNLINQNNQTGFDFLEFTESLLKKNKIQLRSIKQFQDRQNR
jgi:hypothetical protein